MYFRDMNGFVAPFGDEVVCIREMFLELVPPPSISLPLL